MITPTHPKKPAKSKLLGTSLLSPQPFLLAFACSPAGIDVMPLCPPQMSAQKHGGIKIRAGSLGRETDVGNASRLPRERTHRSLSEASSGGREKIPDHLKIIILGGWKGGCSVLLEAAPALGAFQKRVGSHLFGMV